VARGIGLASAHQPDTGRPIWLRSAKPGDHRPVEDGSAWPRRPEDVLLAYANELGMDVRVLWLHGFVLWIENEPVLDEKSQAEIRAAIGRLAVDDEAA
jgi:hypothetical protein